MSHTKQGISWSAPAGADLSAAQYRFVKLDGANVVLCAATTDIPLGILQNDPEEGEHAEVMISGVSPLASVTAGLALGAKVATNAVGRGQAAVSTQHVVGQVLKAASAEDARATVAIDCSAPGVLA